MIDTTAAPLETIERIEHVIPKISDRRERERRGRPFPDLEDKPRKDSPRQAPAPRRPREEADGEERRVDLVVRGRFLPTGQDLPAEDQAPALH